MTKKAKISGYCFYMNANIKGDFQICISAPLTFCNVNNIHVEKYAESMLNIYFPFKKPNSRITIMPYQNILMP